MTKESTTLTKQEEYDLYLNTVCKDVFNKLFNSLSPEEIITLQCNLLVRKSAKDFDKNIYHDLLKITEET